MTVENFLAEVIALFDPAMVARTALEILLILIAFHFIIRFGCGMLDRAVGMTEARMQEGANVNRLITLKGLVKSAFRYTMYFVAALTVLPKMGIETTQFLAGAGVAGLAVGFGAQNLVRDVISGFFFLLEDQFAVGEYVEIDNTHGMIDEMGLRVTKLRDFGGQLHYLPNGSIEVVTNYSRGPMRILVDVDIAYEEDVDRAIAVLEDLCEEMTDVMEILVDGPRVLGLSSLNESSMTLRVWGRAKNMEQWGAEREIRRQIKRRFVREGIEIPYPRRVLVPAARTKIVEEDGE